MPASTRQHLNLDESELLIWQTLLECGDIGVAQEKLATRLNADPQAVAQAVFCLVGKLIRAGLARLQPAALSEAQDA